ncbi:MAG TPA: hypothetical protein VJ779_06855 [Acetobacteraceae bacterium]|nr:hypothetical protein [Acetobacteraceae bacterium]
MKSLFLVLAALLGIAAGTATISPASAAGAFGYSTNSGGGGASG